MSRINLEAISQRMQRHEAAEAEERQRAERGATLRATMQAVASAFVEGSTSPHRKTDRCLVPHPSGSPRPLRTSWNTDKTTGKLASVAWQTGMAGQKEPPGRVINEGKARACHGRDTVARPATLRSFGVVPAREPKLSHVAFDYEDDWADEDRAHAAQTIRERRAVEAHERAETQRIVIERAEWQGPWTPSDLDWLCEAENAGVIVSRL